MNLNALDTFPFITTERLYLKPVSPRNLQDLFVIFSDEKVMKLYGMYALTEYKDAAWFIERFNESFRAKRSIRWGLYLKENDKLIGTCGFHGFNELSSRAEMGYELHFEYWRKGYMSEALSAIIRWGFEKFELNRIEALVYPENTASEAIALSLGFRMEGCLRQYAFFRDIYQDLNMFSLLKQEWEN